MAESDGKGSNKAVAKRATKFRLPDRASRPSDETYFDYVLSAVESDEAKDNLAAPGEVESSRNELPDINPEDSSLVERRDVQIDPASDGTNAGSAAAIDSGDELPETRRSGTPQKSKSAPSAISTAQVTPFDVFKKRWTHFLSDTLVSLCEIIHDNTIAQGRERYDTTARELCQAVGRSKRHTFLLLSQLEKMGFVTRKEIRENNRLIGIRIWFHINPLQR